MDWFEAKVNFNKEVNPGKFKRVSEIYLIAEETVATAEAKLSRILRNVSDYTVQSVKKVKYYSVVNNPRHSKYYKCKVGFISLDELNGIEKLNYVQILVSSGTGFDDAVSNLKTFLSDSMDDYEIANVVEVKYSEVNDEYITNNDAINSTEQE